MASFFVEILVRSGDRVSTTLSFTLYFTSWSLMELLFALIWIRSKLSVFGEFCLFWIFDMPKAIMAMMPKIKIAVITCFIFYVIAKFCVIYKKESAY